MIMTGNTLPIFKRSNIKIVNAVLGQSLQTVNSLYTMTVNSLYTMTVFASFFSTDSGGTCTHLLDDRIEF